MKVPATAQGTVPHSPAAAALELLAVDLDGACDRFIEELRQHSFSWDEGGFGAINNGRAFEKARNGLIAAVRKIVSSRFSELVRLTLPTEGDVRREVERATQFVRGVVAEHCVPRKLLSRAFPSLDNRSILLPPGLTSPDHEHRAKQHICKTMNDAIESILGRAALEVTIHANLDRTSSAEASIRSLKTRKRRKRELRPEDAKRRATIGELTKMGLRGLDYCCEMDRRGIRPPASMIRRGCPDTYRKAYDNPDWRKAHQDEKSRYSKHSPTRAGE